MRDLQKKIKQWDEWIRQGRLEDVRIGVKKLVLKDVPRHHRMGLAKICRRVQMYPLAIKVLFPIVRGDEKLKADASPDEIAEYSASLLRIGSVNEVRGLLSELESSGLPDVFLYSAFAEIVEWNFLSSVDLLHRYLESPDLSDYQRRVAEVNLASSLVGCQKYEEALRLLEKLIAESKTLNLGLIYATSLCYLGGLYVETRDHEAAQKAVEQARAVVPEADYQHNLLLDKILTKLEADRGMPVSNTFDQIKTKARGLGVYEIVRDCDSVPQHGIHYPTVLTIVLNT